MKSLIYGDMHGNTSSMRRAFHLAEKHGCEEVIQAGDYGFGWRPVNLKGDFMTSKTSEAFLRSPGDDRIDFMVAKTAKVAEAYGIPFSWFDGNHENFDWLEAIGAFRADGPVELAPGVTYLPRGTVLERYGSRILIIGGAYSVDKAMRSPHLSWWPQEEITVADEVRCEAAGKVDVVLSHDAPNSAYVAALAQILGDAQQTHLGWKCDERFPGARPNRMALEAILDACRPRLWVHGHYHQHYVAQAKDCQFIGLDHENMPGSWYILEY